jgi:lipid-binding SYLF domain-containing protein
MHITHRIAAVAAATLLSLAAAPGVHAQAREEARILVATEVLEELRVVRDQQIPGWLMQRACGVAVVPDVTKAAFIFGGRFGSGVLSVRDSQGRFSNPVLISLGGGSVGWQAGVQQTDIVLVFTTRGGIDNITMGKLTLGAGASIAAGPVGRQGEVAVSTDAEVYAYSRARGLFAGVALDGTVISVNSAANERLYDRHDVTASEIMNGTASSSSENVRRFVAALTASTDHVPASGPSTAPTAAPAAPAPAPEPAQTFPMEDPK